MAMRYHKLFSLLARNGMRKTDLTKNKIISSATLAKLSKGETVTTDVINNICKALNCQPGDIMEFEEEASVTEYAECARNLTKSQNEIDGLIEKLLDVLERADNHSKAVRKNCTAKELLCRRSENIRIAHLKPLINYLEESLFYMESVAGDEILDYEDRIK